MSGTASDVLERKQAELLAAGQKRALEQIAAGAPTASVLELLMLLVEEQAPGALASVLVLDEDGRRLRDGAGPSLADEYRRAVDGVEIGPSVGSCGTALYRGEPVIVSDIASDPLWADYRELALAHGLRASWSTPIVASSGEPLGAFAIYRREPGSPSARELELIDAVTQLAGIAIERGRSDRRLVETEAKYRTLVEQLPLITYVAALDDPKAPAVYISPQATEMLGYAPAEWVSDPSFWSARLLHPDDRERVLAEHEATRMSGKPFAAEYRLLARDGRTVWVLDRATVIPEAEGRPTCFQGYLLDISAEKQAAEALRQSQELYRLVVENASELICFFALDGQLSFVSPSIMDVLGYRPEEAVGTPFASFVHPDDLAEAGRHVRAALRGERPAATPARLRHKDGRWVTLEGVASPVIDASGRLEGVIATGRDVSELRRLEQMLERSQRLEAIGRIAGGIAHDFNNLLTVILGCSDVLRNQLGGRAALEQEVAEIQATLARARRRLTDPPAPADAESEQLSHELNNLLAGVLGHCELLLDRVREQAALGDEVEQIFRAGESASRLTRQLLAFGRRQVLEPEVIDLNAEVVETVGMLRRTLEESIELRVLSGENLGRVEADRGQLEQVLVNLALNARDAMPGGGTLTIETADVELDEAFVVQHPGARLGPHVRLSVSDTGSGMDAETLTHVFEPFFTTKEHGKGTGLGLASVYGIVKQSGGTIWASSAPAQGSRFAIYLPRVEKPLAPPRASHAGGGPLPRGGETILLVEDQEIVRTLACRVLTKLGYTVIEAAGSAEAIRLCQTGCRPDLVFSDVVLPEMNGPALVERLREVLPPFNVLYTSGYTEEAALKQGVFDQPFLHKPFVPATLAQAVRNALDGAPAPLSTPKA